MHSSPARSHNDCAPTCTLGDLDLGDSKGEWQDTKHVVKRTTNEWLLID